MEVGLRYVYEGNVPGSGGEDTYCPNCKADLIKRYGNMVIAYNLREGACPVCGTRLAGVF